MAGDRLAALADEVGPVGTVEPSGGGTRSGIPAAGAERTVRAPSGILAVEPADMTVRVLAGTSLTDLAAALHEHGQRTTLAGPDPSRSTVGGALASGQSSIRRLGDGPVRDAVLGLRWVSAEGRVVQAGGATVKNVSGYDLCRLMVGSQGTLGVLGEVVLRTRPEAPTSRWLTGHADPWEVRAAASTAVSVLWDGTRTWAMLEGHLGDVEDQAARLADLGLTDDSPGPPVLPAGGRLSIPPAEIRALDVAEHGGFVAEVGVGVVHTAVATPPPPVDPVVAERCRRVRDLLDPHRRFCPARELW